jgi:hypothetical protein
MPFASTQFFSTNLLNLSNLSKPATHHSWIVENKIATSQHCFQCGQEVVLGKTIWNKSWMLLMLEKVVTDLSDDEPVFSPKDFIRYEARRRNVDEESFRIPKRLIVCYEREAFEYAKQASNGKIIDWFYGESRPFCIGTADGKDIGVFRTAVGAPAAVAMLEELVACGAETIFEVGISGGLQSFLKPGDTVVVTEAVRDEGTSSHYLPSEVRLESSAKLRELLVQQLTTDGIEHKTGPVWTTDGVYRETRGKFLKFSC